MFDWVQFLEVNGIPFVTPGAGVGKDHVAISCPWCGGHGPIHHLGISTIGKGYRCWNDQSHKGISPHKLIMALLGCSYQEAERIVSGGSVVSSLTKEDTFEDSFFMNLGKKPTTTKQPESLEFLPEFKYLGNKGSWVHTRAVDYIVSRGYTRNEVHSLASQFELRFAVHGLFAYRIIIPIFVNNILVNWTGRTIDTYDPLRYLSLSHDLDDRFTSRGLPTAVKSIKHCIFDYDRVFYGGNTLVVCEGPFDAMRISWFGSERKNKIVGTCVFGKVISDQQLDTLWLLSQKFAYKYTLFDADAGAVNLPETLGFDTLSLPGGVKDPAELSAPQFDQLFYT